ncbi:hypothetical protein J4437_05025 [Candidatus Woesearchaeota archaeon]|nr:hypothetical protein [Candidatus Woesearchaeota archaeon]
MQKLNILNTREVHALKKKLIEQFDLALEEEYVYLKNNQDKVFLINRDLECLPLRNLIVDRYGLYFAEIMKNGEIRLSKEGTQLLALVAQKKGLTIKNSLKLSTEETKSYFQGQDLDKDLGPESKMVVLYYETDALGCAKYKEKKILNFLPKVHRGDVII